MKFHTPFSGDARAYENLRLVKQLDQRFMAKQDGGEEYSPSGDHVAIPASRRTVPLSEDQSQIICLILLISFFLNILCSFDEIVSSELSER